MRIAQGWAGRRWDVLAALALAGWLGFDLTARSLFGCVPWPDSAVDYGIIYHASRHVISEHQYPADKPYPYPPPAVAIHAASAYFPFTISAALWLTLTGLAALATYAVLARVLALHSTPGVLFALPLAHFVVTYYFQWDMRSINCNLIVLAAVVFGCAALARGRNAASGFWLALAVALKLLPVLLLPYLAWTRRWGAFAWSALFSLVLWVAVPLLAFGTEGFAEVYSGWGTELLRAASPEAKQEHPILISLDRAAIYSTGQRPVPARGIVLSVCVVWAAVGLVAAAISRGKPTRDGFAILAHASLLVIGPSAVNPYLEPYHLVPLAIPSVLLLAAALDWRGPAGVRLAAATGFLVGLVVLKASSPWPLRGLLVNAQAMVLCGTAVFVAWARAANFSPGMPKLESFAALGKRLLVRMRMMPAS